MEITIVLAQILGIMFVVLGLSMLFQKKETILVMEEMIQNKTFMWMGGFLALIMGAVIVALNNVWTSGLPLFVTIIGWLSLIKGAFLLIFPGVTIYFYRKVNKGGIFVFAGLIAFVLGLILLLYK
jgi:hypothetical protein